jgi:hypothetical protein
LEPKSNEHLAEELDPFEFGKLLKDHALKGTEAMKLYAEDGGVARVSCRFSFSMK